jgi:hypothetical protein
MKYRLQQKVPICFRVGISQVQEGLLLAVYLQVAVASAHVRYF